MIQNFLLHVQETLCGSDTWDLHNMFSLVMYRGTRAGQKCPSGIYVKDLFELIGNFLDDRHLTDVMKNKSNWICEHTG